MRRGVRIGTYVRTRSESIIRVPRQGYVIGSGVGSGVPEQVWNGLRDVEEILETWRSPGHAENPESLYSYLTLIISYHASTSQISTG